jgi:hypothetical protein
MVPTEKQNSPPDGDFSDLDWLAFRYVAGELNESEAEAFEQRLAEQQPAREAVASAVEIVETVTAAEHLEEIPMVATAAREASHWRHVAWLAITVGVAACCASLALFYWSGGWQSDQQQPAVASDKVPPASPVVANAWLETFDQPVLDAAETAANEPLDSESAPLFAETTEMVTPDWMAAALAGMSDDTAVNAMDMERGESLPLEN